MSNCCDLEIHNKKALKVLWIALWINLFVFIIQFVAAKIANSTALFADSFDMMGDVFAYAISIYAFSRGEKAATKAALYKGLLICLLAFFVFLDAFKKMFYYELLPSSTIMLIFSVLGLITNGFCLWLLTSYKDANLNMKSVWLCSRNDILANLAVILTAILVFYFHSRWPDVIVGLLLGLVLLKSGYYIIKLSINKLKSL